MAKISLKPVTFKLTAPKAKKVSVAGSFNNWDVKSHLAKKGLKGSWSAKVSLKPGKHEYKFVVDGAWMNDPSCKNSVCNSLGSQNSLVEVK